jgi:uncharacterized membrane protein YeiB
VCRKKFISALLFAIRIQLTNYFQLCLWISVLILVYFFVKIVISVYLNIDKENNSIRDEERVLRSVLQNDLLPFMMQLYIMQTHGDTKPQTMKFMISSILQTHFVIIQNSNYYTDFWFFNTIWKKRSAFYVHVTVHHDVHVTVPRDKYPYNKTK